MPFYWIKEHIVKNGQFWTFGFIGCLILFMTYLATAQFKQIKIQQTGVEQVYENRTLLGEIVKMQSQALLNHEILKENESRSGKILQQIMNLVANIEKNQEYLRENRALWVEGFDRINKRLDKVLGEGK